MKLIELACLMEVVAPKPGNVHPGAAFRDLCFDDFVRAAQVISEPLSAVHDVGLGQAIYNAVRATREVTGTNVNLGIILLLAPLVAVPDEVLVEQGLDPVLMRTTVEDAEFVYAAIRLAQPGGMGDVSSQDIADRPTINLRDAMALAADRDQIAEQYVSGFALVFEARRKLCELYIDHDRWDEAIVTLYVWMMSKWLDTLIVRKCGREIAEQASRRALALMNSVERDGRLDRAQLKEFDSWLRGDGHRRNPGTTADLVAATLFAALRDGLIVAPSRDEINQRAATIRREFLV